MHPHRPSSSSHHHMRLNGHAQSNSSSSSNFSNSESSSMDKVASASTALDRVLGQMDGYEDDMDCPLCLEEMDISDLNFKPCPCGYQICRFCWHHIKENLNGRCPACRAPYDDTTVEFKAIKPDELKRLQAAKKLRDKRRKDDALTVKNMANVRVRQRAQVHIQGMTTKIANEDTLNQLKGSEQFGQYGKVVKLFMSKRSSTITQPTSTHPHYQPVNVYVNYRTPAEASTCIAAMDGSTTSDGHKLKAIWGTTRYCPTYLKGGKCNNENCMQAHEPGEEIEGAGPVSREEIYTYHAMSDSDIQRSKALNAVTQIRKQQEAATLPSTASWASKTPIVPTLPITPIIYNPSLPPLSASIKPPPVARPIPVSKPQNHPLPARPSARAKIEIPVRPATTPPPVEAKPPSPLRIDSTIDTAPVASSSQPPSPVQAPVEPEVLFSNGRAANGVEIRPRPPSVSFPELEFGDGSFSFSLNLDVKGKGRALPPSDDGGYRSTREFANLDGFGRGDDGGMSYMGSFDPFSDGNGFENGSEPHSGSSSPRMDDASRRSSRFGFARQGSMAGVRGPDLASALARFPFTSGRESPVGMSPSSFAPPGMPMPQHRPPSAMGYGALSPAMDRDGGRSADASSLWSGNSLSTPYNGSLPPATLRSLAPSGQSGTPSPQLSPRSRAGFVYGGTPPGVNGTTSLPPGLSLNRTPIPAASFPLPPPAPRPSGQQSTIVGKDDIFALIAAAQSSAAPKQHNQEPHPFFSDPAILNASYASSNGMTLPPSAAYHSLDGGMSSPQNSNNNNNNVGGGGQGGYNLGRGYGGPELQQAQFGYGPPGVVRPQMQYPLFNRPAGAK